MANPYSAWVVKAMVFTVPPVAVALKPETKLREVKLPFEDVRAVERSAVDGVGRAAGRARRATC